MAGVWRWGCCLAPVENALRVAQEAGYDFAEISIAGGLRPEAPATEIQTNLAAIRAVGLPVEAANSFLPGDLKVVGRLIDQDRLRRYVAIAIERAADLGIQVIVFGSGAARRVPSDFSPDEAWTQLVSFLSMVADLAQGSGITWAIEPLNRGETNIVNSVADGVRLAQAVQRPEVRVLSDLYHVTVEAEPFAQTAEAAEWLVHVHVADTGRYQPGSGSYDYPGYLAALKQAGYRGRISIECSWPDFAADAAPALAFLRRVASTM